MYINKYFSAIICYGIFLLSFKLKLKHLKITSCPSSFLLVQLERLIRFLLTLLISKKQGITYFIYFLFFAVVAMRMVSVMVTKFKFKFLLP